MKTQQSSILVRLTVFVIFFNFLFVGCDNSSDQKKSEGYILYEVIPVCKKNWMSDFAPHEMTLRFRKGSCAAEMSAMGGIFRSDFIIDLSDRSFTQIVKVWNDKFFSVQSESELKREMNNNTEIIFSDDEKEIAGYTCKKAMVKSKYSKVFYEIWYTEELGFRYPGFAMPYKGLKGIPLDYRIDKFGLELRFIAKKVITTSINDKFFKTPAGYTRVSTDSIASYFSKLGS